MTDKFHFYGRISDFTPVSYLFEYFHKPIIVSLEFSTEIVPEIIGIEFRFIGPIAITQIIDQ